jgi:hypothetical protein
VIEGSVLHHHDYNGLKLIKSRHRVSPHSSFAF